MRTTLLALTGAAAVSAGVVNPRQSAGSTACAEVSASSSSFMAANPTATVALVDGPVVYDCLQSIPINQQNALTLLQSLEPYMELQSTISYLRSPPVGYLYPSIDIITGFRDIAAAVAAGKYVGEYDFQTDLHALLVSARDGHLTFQGDLAGIAAFKVPNTPLVSFSANGIDVPSVYCTSDMLALSPYGIGFRNTSIGVPYTPSAVTTVNGVDTLDYLMGRAEEFSFQDPDAAYNYLFSETVQIAQLGVYGDGGFANPAYYPGAATIIGFANGTFNNVTTGTEIYANFDGVYDGESAYQKFCGKTTFQNPSPPNLTQQLSPIVPFYPWPVLKNSQNRVAGYFLNDTGNTDVAVLSILNFDAETNALEFQQNVRDFLNACRSSGKSNLVIDIMGNGGGFPDLGLDTFAQLFPDVYPLALANMRASDVLNYLGLGDSILGQSAPLGQPFDVNSDLSANGSAFASWSQMYGPVKRANDNYTNLFQEKIVNGPTAIQITTGGSNDSRPFAVENIVMLTDGYCAGTCAVFVELMKNLVGVKTIAVGGRPMQAPMQGVGGTKGMRSFGLEYILGHALNASEALTFSVASTANKTAFAEFSDYPVVRAYDPLLPSVNGENNIRVGDKSVTPLQFVYEAADCRFFFTQEMLVSQVPIWSRAANISFHGQTDQCIPQSLGHASSVSGGCGNAPNKGVGLAPPISAQIGSLVSLTLETNSTVGSNSTKGWGGKAWGVGGWNLAAKSATNSTSKTATKSKATTSKTSGVSINATSKIATTAKATAPASVTAAVIEDDSNSAGHVATSTFSLLAVAMAAFVML